MAIEALPSFAQLPSLSADRLLLIWQHPHSRRFRRVGRLHHLADGRYAFEYLPDAKDPAFAPLAEFPEVGQIYVTSALPAFFDNRVMSRERESYDRYLHYIGVDGADTPFEILARTGGSRATDTFHVVRDVHMNGPSSAVVLFLASGVRHIPGADKRLAALRDGATLKLREELDNPENPRALLIDVVDGAPVGWVPDWLLDDVHTLREKADSTAVTAERVNPDAPAHLRLLCRFAATASDAVRSDGR